MPEFASTDKPSLQRFAGQDFDPDNLDLLVFPAGPHVITNERRFWRKDLEQVPAGTARHRAAHFLAKELDLCATMQYVQSMSKDPQRVVGSYIAMTGLVATSRLVRILTDIDPTKKYIIDHDIAAEDPPGMHIQREDLEDFGLYVQESGARSYFENRTLYVATSAPANISESLEAIFPPHLDSASFVTVTPRLKLAAWTEGFKEARLRVN